MGNEQVLSDDLGDLPKSSVFQIENQSSSSEILDAEIDPQLSKRLDRKFDIHIIPWIFGIW